MITDKTCETCEYFSAWKSRCALRHMLTARGMDCPLWRGKHGEWMPMALCKPEDKEKVILPGGGLFKYNTKEGSFDKVSDCFNRIASSEVKCWLRLPEVYVK